MQPVAFTKLGRRSPAGCRLYSAVVALVAVCLGGAVAISEAATVHNADFEAGGMNNLFGADGHWFVDEPPTGAGLNAGDGASGWMVVSSGSASGSITGSDAPGLLRAPTPPYIPPHSGHIGAAFSSLTLYDQSLQQAISTTPGQLYALHFWLLNPDPGGTVNLFSVKWGGTEVRPMGVPPVGSNWVVPTGATWTEYVVQNLAGAAGATTLLSFSASNSSFTWLDDVSILNVPEPTTASALAIGTLGLALRRRRARSAA